jgi:hypothetical protein
VFLSVWRVIDAVNRCPELAFNFPSCHNKQHEIALGFKEKSRPEFGCCAGAIDGMLLWIEWPSEEECELARCGSVKFFCGRKHKFGLNLQGTCDSEGCFLDVCIGHPASTSDYLSFATSSFKAKLEILVSLAPGLCIFGDNAYVNCSYMAMPYKNVPSGSKDNYNHYHSQVSWTFASLICLLCYFTKFLLFCSFGSSKLELNVPLECWSIGGEFFEGPCQQKWV